MKFLLLIIVTINFLSIGAMGQDYYSDPYEAYDNYEEPQPYTNDQPAFRDNQYNNAEQAPATEQSIESNIVQEEPQPSDGAPPKKIEFRLVKNKKKTEDSKNNQGKEIPQTDSKSKAGKHE